ncbi:MAG: FAD-dependent oxidoreductase [Burkholderiales bacterium]|nr:FAD-dependent oxidoreductase [Burkholderiales bacterium]
MAKPEFDICVIGGGSAGLTAAAGAALLGAKVALIEKRALGGECLFYGCVPSKSLLYSAKVAQTVRKAGRFGVDAEPPRIDLARVMQRVQSVIKAIEPHDSPERFRGLGIDVVFGHGQFVSRAAFKIGARTITAKKFVIATGSQPAIAKIPGLDGVPYLTNETVFGLSEAVPSLIILGGGPIGIEIAQAFKRLGSEVHVVERESRILANDDAEAAQIVHNRLAAEGVQFHLDASLERVDGSAGAISAQLQLGGGAKKVIAGSHILVAVGRKANVEGLGCEAAGVEVNKGGVKTDARLRTTNRNIYACGDVSSHLRFTHMAEYQAGIVLRNALFHLPAKVDARAVPWCTFTDPELAHVGLTEQQAKNQKLAYEVHRAAFADNDRAQAEGVADEIAGFAKLVTDDKGRLLGATVVGPHAGELIHELVVLVAKHRKVADIENVIHIYPTLAQIVLRAAQARRKAYLTPQSKKWITFLFRLRGR